MGQSSREYRNFNVEWREGEDGKIRGHAAVFNIESNAGRYFREKVASGAFADSIQKDDVRALWNHDANYVLGRNVSGTLTLREDAQGLYYEIDPPDTQWARDLIVSMKRGDITQSSFGFEVIKQEWVEEKDALPLRIIREAKLWDVSPVTYPFYQQTDVAMRSLDEFRNSSKPAESESVHHTINLRLQRAKENLK